MKVRRLRGHLGYVVVIFFCLNQKDQPPNKMEKCHENFANQLLEVEEVLDATKDGIFGNSGAFLS